MQTCNRSWWIDHKDRDQARENKKQKDLKEYLDCKFIRINPDEKDFSAYDELSKVQTFIEKSKEKNKRTQKRNKRIQRRNKEIQRINKRIQRKKKRSKRQK